MSPFAINRRLLWVAVGAVGAGAYLFMRHRIDAIREREEAARDVTTAKDPARARTTTTEARDDERPAAAASSSAGAAEKEPAGPGGEQELSEFLAGDSWYDEGGWRTIWEREGIADASAWLRADGKAVLSRARTQLSDHPALLAGCRRRWIVVCRYAGIDVSDAASLWNETDG